MKRYLILIIFLLISGALFASDVNHPDLQQDTIWSDVDDSFFEDDDEFFDDEYDEFSGRDATRYTLYAVAAGAAIFVVSNPWLLLFL